MRYSAAVVMLIGIASAATATALASSLRVSPFQQANSVSQAMVLAKARSIRIDPQTSCLQTARKQARRLGWERDRRVTFQERYNQRRARCFIAIEIAISDGKRRTDIFRTLSDGTGREYANFMAANASVSEAEFPPVMCEFILPSGEEIQCHSADEFNQIVKDYME